MKQLKKTLLTLVALLAVTTGAWADGIVCTASDLGKVLCTDGSIYENVSAATTAGKTAAAVIAYVDETNKNGLAIALSDEGEMNWSTAKSTCEGKTAVTSVAWLLPSVEQWRAMFKAFGGNERSYTGLNTAITTAEGTALQGNAYYWSLTDEGGDNAYAVYLVGGSGGADWYDDSKSGSFRVRACLAFDIAAASGPTVTFTASDLADGSSITKDGVTLTGYGQYGINMNGITGPGEFTNSLGGNFTKIVVTADNLPSGDGWSAGTWTGSASSVSFTGNIDTWGNEFSIVCTLETASSGPTVDWDKTSKTGTFTMPGGNVTLEPEYYPQAALAAKPTAIDNVPATTDGAIVKAGTVANIGETTTAQGTVMYYVSPTALDDAALLVLDADKWTADVPTAESLAEGEYHVYYYVRGNDSETDAENFSDGDILAANALTVTIAAAPTYAVTFADDTAEPDKWTASPAADVTKGQTVTVTYTGTKKVLGVKAEKKAKGLSISLNNPAVGQLIGNDGKNYDATATLPDGVTAVAMICHLDGDHGVALALEDYGFNTWNAVKEALENYEPKFTNATWDMPTEDEWGQMNQTAGGYGALRDSFQAVGGTNMQKSAYWSSTSVDANNAKSISFFNGSWSSYGKDNDRYTRLRLAW